MLNKKPRLITADSNRWDSIWARGGKEKNDWDYLSEVIYQVLKREIGDFKGKDIIETGSGSGRISLKLAKLLGRVALLDYSLIALNISGNMFSHNKLEGSFIQGDILNMPIKDSSYDVAWNAGVMEHYPYGQQSKILRNLVRISKKDGLIITLNPYSRSIVYNLGKKLLIMLNRWIFGKEYPIRSICDIYTRDDRNCDIKEYSIGFIVCFVDSYKFLPGKLQQLKIVKRLSKIFIKLAPQLVGLDKFLSGIFGGYLIVSVIRKKEG